MAPPASLKSQLHEDGRGFSHFALPHKADRQDRRLSALVTMASFNAVDSMATRDQKVRGASKKLGLVRTAKRGVSAEPDRARCPPWRGSAAGFDRLGNQWRGADYAPAAKI